MNIKYYPNDFSVIHSDLMFMSPQFLLYNTSDRPKSVFLAEVPGGTTE